MIVKKAYLHVQAQSEALYQRYKDVCGVYEVAFSPKKARTTTNAANAALDACINHTDIVSFDDFKFTARSGPDLDSPEIPFVIDPKDQEGDYDHADDQVVKVHAMQEYTVLATVADEGTLSIHRTYAIDPYHAFFVIAKIEQEKDDGQKLEFLAAMPGRKAEGVDFVLPGEGIVCAETVLEQEDVFGPGDTEEQPQTQACG